MKKFLFLLFCICTGTVFFSCKDNTLETVPLEVKEEIIADELQARPPIFKRKLKVELGHHGVYDPHNPDHCGNKGGCACPMGICISLVPKSVAAGYEPSPEEVEDGIGTMNFSVYSSTQVKLEFLQDTALPDGTIPIDDLFPIEIENDPTTGGTVIYTILPKVYQVDFSDSPFGFIIADFQ